MAIIHLFYAIFFFSKIIFFSKKSDNQKSSFILQSLDCAINSNGFARASSML